MKKGKLDVQDHSILLALIRGLTAGGAAQELHMSMSAVNTRLQRMKLLLECDTLYQLIALEVVNLLDLHDNVVEDTDPDTILKPVNKGKLSRIIAA